MFSLRVRHVLLAAAATLLSMPVLAQGGGIAGTVTAGDGGTPVQGVRVQALASNGQAVAAVLTRDDGTYRIGNLAAGTYSLVARRLGYGEKRVDNISVSASGTTTANIQLVAVVTELNPVVTTASRKPEKALDAPASISVVDVRDIQERPSVTVADHLKGLPGVDIQTGGIAQSNIVARGFNNAFSGSILTLQDYRFAAVPSLRVNIPFLFTATNEDIERVEVLLGPASALYGPNSANGVLHVITKSPFSSQGTTVTIDGGERSLLRGSFRTAGLFTPKLGYKISGEAFTANDWAGETARDTLGNRIVGAGGRPVYDPGEPDVFPPEAPASRRGQPNIRDFDLRKYTGEARIDYRPSADKEFVTTVGVNMFASGLDYTGANGTGQIKNWLYRSIQQRARVGRWFAQAFLNVNNAGNDDSLDTDGTFLLRSGQPIVDQSRVFAAQLQHGFALGSKQDFVYGLDFINTDARTGGTINGRNEEDDGIREIGGYIQSTTNLSSKFDFIAALRADNNNRIEGNQISPRVALIFKPSATQNFRATFNRAFSTPANFSYFLDLIQARNIGNSGYNIRALGNPPKEGWTFNRSCGATNGGLCMKSRFSGGNNWVPSSAAAMFPGVVAGLRSTLVAQLTPAVGATIANQLVSFLGTLRPTDAQVGSRMSYLNAPTAALQPGQVGDIRPLDASYNKTYELGYKGILGNRARLAIDAWVQQRGDVGNPAGLSTPNIFFNGPQLGAYLGPNIAQALIAAGLPAQQAAAAATQIATQIATLAGSLPVGIVQFNDDRFANGTDLYATYTSQSDQEITVRGLDAALDFVLNDKWTLAGMYSYVSKTIFEDVTSSNGTALMLNSPGNKGSLTLKYRNEGKGIGFEARTRFSDAYPVNSGVYAAGPNLQGRPITFQRPGTTTSYRYDAVEAATVFDLGFNYRLPIAGAKEVMLSVNGTNVFDQGYRTMPGAPLIGRLFLTRVQYSF
ncbi:MAG: TonB-dependent receptor [Gemmatimonadetes bacterium]|nr:TonB-dependent receptor [Gemmatimonadota bacterium]